MSTSIHPLISSTIHRRDFLRTIGVALGGLAVGRWPVSPDLVDGAPSNVVPALNHMPRIGLLLPRSSMYPRLGESLAAGLSVSLNDAAQQQSGCAGKLHIKEVGVKPSDALEKARSLIAEDDVDILVGVINPSVAVDLHPALASNRRFLILVEAGANIVRESEYSPHIFHNTLGYWRASQAMGEWTVRTIGKRVFIASSFYESGYDALHMFRLGVEESGGKVVRTSITHVPPSVMGMSNVMSAIAAERPDVVFAMYAGEEATDFARAYSSSPAVKDIPLVGSTFMTEGTEVSAMMPGLKSCSSWAPGVQGRTNESFKGAFREKMGYGPDVFAVLGYDTGRLILNAAQAAGGDLRSVRRVREALCAAMVMSPRGLLRMDHETHDMTTPLYLCEARARDLDVENLVVDPLTPPSGADHRTTALRGETRTGWLNAYLVA